MISTAQKISLVALASFSLLLSGCSSTPSSPVSSYYDMRGLRTDILAENVLDGGPNEREMIWLNASRLYHENGRATYYLEVRYAANEETGYLEIYPGRTLNIVADGQQLRFSGLGSLEQKKDGKVVYEDARYEASVIDLHTIANARKVTVIIKGKNSLVTREFSPENFQRFREFVAQEKLPNTRPHFAQ
ncbi:MAG: hypothetical protein SFY81_10035 [Verrucomicrobiota bacterium]|nr:hypothetical protein [Verrucomicrobiota bacterium]